MKKLKPFILGGIIGGLAVWWCGMNIAKNQPLWSNPLAEVPVGEQLRRAGGKALEKSGEALNRQGEQLQRKLNQ